MRREGWNERRFRMICERRLLSIICFLLALTMLEGCGHNAATGATVPPTVTTEPSHPAGTGTVTLRSDAPSYRGSDAISVTLSNQRVQTIQFPDHLTNCTVVLLQRNVNGSWESINLCKLMIATRMHSLESGQSLAVKLVAPANQWFPGLYRVRLSYSASQELSHTITIYSAIFQVR